MRKYSMQKVRYFSCKSVWAAARAPVPLECGVRYLDRYCEYGPLILMLWFLGLIWNLGLRNVT